MDADPDDLLPDQIGKTPSAEEFARRQALQQGRLGRWGRLRSWLTVLIGILALAASYYVFGRTT